MRIFILLQLLLCTPLLYAYESLVAQIPYADFINCSDANHNTVQNFNQALHGAVMTGKHVIPFNQPQQITNFLISKPKSSDKGFHVDFGLGECSSLDLTSQQATCAITDLKMVYAKPKPYNEVVYLDAIVSNQAEIAGMMQALHKSLQDNPDLTVALDGWGTFKWDTKSKQIKYKGIKLADSYERAPAPEFFNCGGSEGIGNTPFEVEIMGVSLIDVPSNSEFSREFVMVFFEDAGSVDVWVKSRYKLDQSCTYDEYGEPDYCFTNYDRLESDKLKVTELNKIYTLNWNTRFNYEDVIMSISFKLTGINNKAYKTLNWSHASTVGTYNRHDYTDW